MNCYKRFPRFLQNFHSSRPFYLRGHRFVAAWRALSAASMSSSSANNSIGNDAVVVLPNNISTMEPKTPLALGKKLTSFSGQVYQIERILQERIEPSLSCVYLAKNESQRKYILKNIYHSEFEYQLKMQQPLARCPNLRVVNDTIPEHLLFVYDYLTGDLLQLAVKDNLSDAARRRILRDALSGLAYLHANNIFHTDIKPNNILVDYVENSDGTIDVKKVQLGDLEMGSIVPEGLSVRGARLGNPMWRSPESYAAARQNLPSDIFSFGLVCIFTMLRKIIFQVENQDLAASEQERIIVRRMLSHFGDGPGLVGFIGTHLAEDSEQFRELMLGVLKEFTPENPRRPFSMWDIADEDFREVVTRMTTLDPSLRITAGEALEHPWFKTA